MEEVSSLTLQEKSEDSDLGELVINESPTASPDFGTFRISNPLHLRTLFDLPQNISEEPAEPVESAKPAELRQMTEVKNNRPHSDPTSFSQFQKMKKKEGRIEDYHHSKETRKKSERMKRLMEEHYWNIWDYLVKRKHRFESFRAALETSNLTTDIEKELAVAQYLKKETSILRARRLSAQLYDFQVIKKIGKGAYGVVYLARKKSTNELLALKKISKENLEAKNQVATICSEADVLSEVGNRWLVELKYTFQDSKNIYFAMEYVPGGDLRSYLDNVGDLPESDAMFYLAEIVLAVDALHRLGYIHRDLKPDNFLFDKFGHLKLADFGLSKKGIQEAIREPFRGQLPSVSLTPSLPPFRERKVSYQMRKKTYSLVGSPDYMAVEMLRETGYDFKVDYWSIGCILFELLMGYPPFTAETPHEVFSNVLNYRTTLVNPRNAPSQPLIGCVAWDLVTHLICEAQDRYGLKQVQAHPFFEGFDWNNLQDRSPPFRPQLESDDDTQYFNTESDSSTSTSTSSSSSPEDDFPSFQERLLSAAQRDFPELTFAKTVFQGKRSPKEETAMHGKSVRSVPSLERLIGVKQVCMKESSHLTPDFTRKEPKTPVYDMNSLSKQDWRVLCTGARITRYERGNYIVKEGCFNKYLYRIKSGEVRVERKEHGSSIILARFGKNKVFGEVSFVEDEEVLGQTVTASIVVESPEVELYQISRDFIFRIFKIDPQLFGRFYKILALTLAARLSENDPLHPKPPLESSTPPVDRPVDKSAKFRSKFNLESDEELLEQHNCCCSSGNQKMKGIIMMGKRNFCFFAKLFGYKWKVVIPYYKISDVKINLERDSMTIFSPHGEHSFNCGEELHQLHKILSELIAQCKDSHLSELSPREEHQETETVTFTGTEATKESLRKELTISQEDWSLILKGANSSIYHKDEVIVLQGEPSTRIFQIASGSCRVEKMMGGKYVLLSTMSNADMFGEIGFLTGVAAASVTANENNVEIYIMEKEYIEGLFSQFPYMMGKFHKFLSWVLARRLRVMNCTAIEEPSV